MELYELRQKTHLLYLNLRKYGTIGPENYGRRNGKTTALMIYAKELLDTSKPGERVWYACKPTSLYKGWFRGLFPQAVSLPDFVSAAPHVEGVVSGHLLVDEPYLLKWDEHEWNLVTRPSIKIVTVGRAF